MVSQLSPAPFLLAAICSALCGRVESSSNPSRVDMVRDVPGHLLLSLKLGYVLEWFWISAGNSHSRESIAIPHSSAIWEA